MAYDYALVHLKSTIPLAGILTLISYPLLTRRHWCLTAILITIAVVATIPWDSHLIRSNVWSYPPDAILGPTFWSIPAEELFFFVIQTYNTSLLYHLLNKPLLHAEYLLPSSRLTAGLHRLTQATILTLALVGLLMVSAGGPGTYMGLILIWVCPFALLAWSVGGPFLITLPWTSTVVPIVLPTLYLWVVDEMALGNGTWAIEPGTKLGVKVWGSLEVEEAVFFLATNVLIVFGLGAFDYGLAVADVFPDVFCDAAAAPGRPAVVGLLRAVVMTWSGERKGRVRGIQEAVRRLCRKSRSFYLASSFFTGRLRIDLVLLYSYCRMADDLIDEPPEGLDASAWIERLSGHLDLVYKPKKGISPTTQADTIHAYIANNFPPSARSALSLLPSSLLPPEPLYLLLEGFKTDSRFQPNTTQKKGPHNHNHDHFPIADEYRLREYASQVAGTVGQLCLSLIAYHSSSAAPLDSAHGAQVVAAAAGKMGVALQLVNIARDVAVDAVLGRVYLPTTWLAEEGMTPAQLVEDIARGKGGVAPGGGEKAGGEARDVRLESVGKMRRRLLGEAFAIYRESRGDMAWLPGESRRPMVVAVESYMEIGRVLLEGEGSSFEVVEGRPSRATVPKARRLEVALKALLSA